MAGGKSLKPVQLLCVVYTMQEQVFPAAISSGHCPAPAPPALLILQLRGVLSSAFLFYFFFFNYTLVVYREQTTENWSRNPVM